MYCPGCGTITKVVASRLEPTYRYRWRICPNCGKHISTIERLYNDITPPKEEKHDG